MGKDVIEMLTYVIGTVGFVIYLLYDANSILWHNRILQKGFLLGTILVFLATVNMVREAFPVMAGFPFGRILFGLLGFLGLLGLIYTLFFAIPFDETYRKDSQERLAYTEKMYAVCRHPGVLWYALVYLALAAFLGTGRAWMQACFFIAWNVVYILYQDAWIFPKTFSNYKDYRRSTPFLIPNPSSIRRCIGSFRR